jgi:hypothetical protein
MRCDKIPELASKRLKRRFSAEEIDKLVKDRAYRVRKVTMSATGMNCCNGCPCILFSTACPDGGSCGTDCCTSCPPTCP